jgi:hypothetical protein
MTEQERKDLPKSNEAAQDLKFLARLVGVGLVRADNEEERMCATFLTEPKRKLGNKQQQQEQQRGGLNLLLRFLNAICFLQKHTIAIFTCFSLV